jgi:hypothetical protein
VPGWGGTIRTCASRFTGARLNSRRNSPDFDESGHQRLSVRLAELIFGCRRSNPAAPASRSGLHCITREGRSKPRGTARFRRYELVSVCGIWQWKRRSCLLSPLAFFGVSFSGAFRQQRVMMHSQSGGPSPQLPQAALEAVLTRGRGRPGMAAVVLAQAQGHRAGCGPLMEASAVSGSHCVRRALRAKPGQQDNPKWECHQRAW